MKHNNQIPNGHFHKDWQQRVRTWFNQPGRKRRHRNIRAEKAARLAPKPLELLRPAVRCPTTKYNIKLRAGRGFTLEELKTAGILKKQALNLGIPVDHRRRNRSEESLRMNVQRLKHYQSKLIVFPKGKSAQAMQVETPSCVQKGILPIKNTYKNEKPRAIQKEEKESSAYIKLRMTHGTYKVRGLLNKKLQEKLEGEKNK